MHSDRHLPRLASGGISLTRRQLLAALALAPWLMRQASASTFPQRIIALEWLPLEMLMALGVMPLAAADTRDYRLWVKEPVLPASLTDVGTRSEPNLEFIAGLQPDLLLYSEGYGAQAAQLQKIAPAMEFTFTDQQGHPLQQVRHGLLRLAQRLGKVDTAHAHLAAFDRQLATARQQLSAWQRQPLLVFSLIDERHVLILGKRSLFGNVMQQLGIENAWQGADSAWGTATVGLEQLAAFPALRAICLEHGDSKTRQRVSRTPLWQALPFVRQGAVRTVAAIWVFGATLAAGRFCQMLQELDKKW